MLTLQNACQTTQLCLPPTSSAVQSHTPARVMMSAGSRNGLLHQPTYSQTRQTTRSIQNVSTRGPQANEEVGRSAGMNVQTRLDIAARIAAAGRSESIIFEHLPATIVGQRRPIRRRPRLEAIQDQERLSSFLQSIAISDTRGCCIIQLLLLLNNG